MSSSWGSRTISTCSTPAPRSRRERPRRGRAILRWSQAYLGAGAHSERGRKQPVAIAAAEAVDDSSARCRAGYGAATVLRRADFELPQGELVAVLGANGAGKSTLMRSLSGLLRPVDGRYASSANASTIFPAIGRARRSGAGAGRPAGISGIVGDRQHPPRRLCAQVATEEASMIETCSPAFRLSKARQYSAPGSCPAASSRCSRLRAV